jgi:hypothetical protein
MRAGNIRVSTAGAGMGIFLPVRSERRTEKPPDQFPNLAIISTHVYFGRAMFKISANYLLSFVA